VYVLNVRNGMLPNLRGLRLTTSEPYEITRDDERRNGGPFKTQSQ